MSYRDYTSRMLYTSQARRLGNTDLFNTRYDLFTEYSSEVATANVYTRRFNFDFAGQQEVDFYILMDYLTFIPFGMAGRRELDQKLKSVDKEDSVEKYKLRTAVDILRDQGINLSEEEKGKLAEFFASYNNPVQPATPAGYATIVRKISDQLYNMITLNKIAGSIGKSKDLSFRLKTIAQDVFDSELSEVDLRNYISPDMDLQELDEGQKAFLEEQLGLTSSQYGPTGN